MGGEIELDRHIIQCAGQSAHLGMVRPFSQGDRPGMAGFIPVGCIQYPDHV
jgi:hypothetical protein